MKNVFKKYPIDSLLYGGFSIFIILLLIVVISLSYTLSSQEMVRMTSFYQQRILDELYNKIEIQMRSIEQVSLAASRNPVLSEYKDAPDDVYIGYRKNEEMESFLASITYATPIIQSIEMYTKTAPQSKPQSPVVFMDEEKAKQEDWYPLVDNSDFTWISEHMIKSYQGEQNVISFARKVYSVNGDYLGILVLNVKASSIQNSVRGEAAGANRVLLDSGGRVITSVGDPKSKNMVKTYMPEMIAESGYMKSNPDESGERIGHSTRHLIVWAKHFNVNWSLVELTPWDQVTGGSVRTAMILSLVGLSAIVVSIFFTLLLSKQFIRPIRMLLHEMGRYTANVYKVNLPEDYRNEFGVLFSGYRKLMDRIQSLYVSLEEQYMQQKRTEIKALQAMINPHFLYNTLDQLNWMAITAGQDKLSVILELMGKMFRIGLSNGESLIRIEEEFTHAGCYMEIQQLRWEEGLAVHIDVPDNIKHYYIPKMTLQPFIENAIIHGFNERMRGRIEITAMEDGQDMFIVIKDDGAGLKNGWADGPSRNTGGYGIRNVRERFDAFFGDDYTIHIANNDNGCGASVTIRFPLLASGSMESLNRRVQAAYAGTT
ncbi:cache domain-containing sensor histidine kinase [Paenibacillus thalictri]|uniref:Sensor histidine kinase n=1 Tax=Paenibacillus thalictri TaxID=2527873 RepID=A0A4Q9DEN9_9BACL|nr:sensor histidine kinase [Paenibacillus thalictri]TBL70089.1 sensor histidine kinase [Paenibacillus thalictri]